MIDYHSTLVSALKQILPTHYEMTLHSGIETPCISYMELSNAAEEEGDTLGYSRLQYQIKLWGNEIATLQRYAQQIDAALRPLGWKRINSVELYDPNSTMMQKVMTFEATGFENF